MQIIDIYNVNYGYQQFELWLQQYRIRRRNFVFRPDLLLLLLLL